MFWISRKPSVITIFPYKTNVRHLLRNRPKPKRIRLIFQPSICRAYVLFWGVYRFTRFFPSKPAGETPLGCQEPTPGTTRIAILQRLHSQDPRHSSLSNSWCLRSRTWRDLNEVCLCICCWCIYIFTYTWCTPMIFYVHMYTYVWMFPKIVVPPNHPFECGFPLFSPSILGAHPYFWKHPYMYDWVYNCVHLFYI